MAETQRLQLEWAERDKELAARTDAQGTIYDFQLTEAQVLALASRILPNSVVAMARSGLEWMDQDRRKEETDPELPKKRKRA